MLEHYLITSMQLMSVPMKRDALCGEAHLLLRYEHLDCGGAYKLRAFIISCR